MSPVLFYHTLKCVWHCFPPIKGTQIFLRSGVGLLREVFSAYRAAPEPSERRAIMGFYKRTIFLNPVKWLSFFERRQAYFVLPFFNAHRLPLHPKKMRDERFLLLYNFFVGKAVLIRIFGRAVKVFFSVQFFRQRRASKNQTIT